MLFECWMMNTAWLTFPQHEVKFYLSLYCTYVLYNCALQCPSLWLNLIWIYDILYYCTVLSLLSHFLAMSFYHPGYIVASWWCVTLGYCIEDDLKDLLGTISPVPLPWDEGPGSWGNPPTPPSLKLAVGSGSSSLDGFIASNSKLGWSGREELIVVGRLMWAGIA